MKKIYFLEKKNRPGVGSDLNSLVHAVNILDIEYLRNSFKIKSDQHALLSLS